MKVHKRTIWVPSIIISSFMLGMVINRLMSPNDLYICGQINMFKKMYTGVDKIPDSKQCDQYKTYDHLWKNQYDYYDNPMSHPEWKYDKHKNGHWYYPGSGEDLKDTGYDL